jgi:tRNA(fMet)-specific endonuclease VapC
MCADALRGREPVRARLREARFESAIAAATVAELLYGAERSDEPERNRGEVAGLVGRLTILALDWGVALQFGRIKADLQARGELIPDFDLAVAATALAHSLTLVTGNTAHFARIAGLQVENWRE